MTSRERILAAVAREPVDYVPCSVVFNPLTPTQRRGHQWQFPWAPDAPADEQLRYQVEELGLDQVAPFAVSAARPAEGAEAEVRRDGDVLHIERLRGAVEAGEPIVASIKGADRTITLTYDLSDRERQIALAGGRLNYIRRRQG